jgi:hypothetical protein
MASELVSRVTWLNDQSMMGYNNVPEVCNYKDYGAVKELPGRPVQVNGGILGYNEPLLTADGAPVTNTGNGTWGQLYRAGKY